MSYWQYPRYVSIAEKKAKAEKKLKQLKKKNPGLLPVVIEANALAHTWWGKAWNKNLESYADYSNRIGRGRSYVRHGAVLDLQINSGEVRALVQGTRSKPYEIIIKIKDLGKKELKEIKKQCEGKLKSLQDLLAGKFPEVLSDIFLTKGKGLFPAPKEIQFKCSCPDWASMCKHVAAALYGTGARLDEDPSLFFKLRNVELDGFVTSAVKDKTGELLAKTRKKSAKVIDDADLSDIFGIDMEGKISFAGKKEKPQQKEPMPEKTAKISSAATRTRSGRQMTPKTAADQVANLVKNSKNGINIKELKKQTGFSKVKLYNIVHRLKLQGIIANKSHGVYIQA